ncbi:hypothetical protein ONZ45_g19050 [Pleurotus djamor]|nr:hypothetical protein ONZ45_g19050 [Pleurotus djamor]
MLALENKSTFHRFITRQISLVPTLIETVQTAVCTGNLQPVCDLPFYRRPPPLVLPWLPGNPDLHIVWDKASEGIWIQTVSDSQGSEFSILHPDLGLQSEGPSPVVVLEEYEDMWNALMLVAKLTLLKGKSTFLQYAIARGCSERLSFIIASTTWSDAIVYFDGTHYPRVIARDDMEDTPPETFVLVDARLPYLTLQPFLKVFRHIAVLASECWHWAYTDEPSYVFFHVKPPSLEDLNRIVATSNPDAPRPDLSLLPYIGPCIWELTRIKSREDVVAQYSEYAQIAARIGILNGDGSRLSTAIPERWPQFRCFFFMKQPSAYISQIWGVPSRLQVGLFEPWYAIPTPWQYQLFRNAVRALQVEKDQPMLKEFAVNNHATYSIAFETHILNCIQKGELRDKYKTRSGKSRHLPRKLRELLPGYGLKVDGPSRHDRDHWDASQSYFIPTADAFPLIDAAIIIPRRVILLQLSIANHRSVEPDGIRVVHGFMKAMEGSTGKCNYGRKWTCMFVVDEESSGTSLVEAESSREAVAMCKEELGIKLHMTFLRVVERPKVDVSSKFGRPLFRTGAFANGNAV